ncbi:hypothetical protein [Halorientalis persicus]|uniref:hypothetical protein n=1 Tax=Halorientalis persicus TaxID=1367881 RepID=UPI001114396A|nr:hypothetical protein [Halorientalis persicus]
MPDELAFLIATGELGVEEQRPLVAECQLYGDGFVLEFDEDALCEGHLARFWKRIRNAAVQV